MTKPTKVMYEHLKDYPTPAEGYQQIRARAVAAAVYGGRMSASSDAGSGREPARPDRRIDPVEST